MTFLRCRKRSFPIPIPFIKRGTGVITTPSWHCFKRLSPKDQLDVGCLIPGCHVGKGDAGRLWGRRDPLFPCSHQPRGLLQAPNKRAAEKGSSPQLNYPSCASGFSAQQTLVKIQPLEVSYRFSTFSLSSWRFGRIRTREIFRERVRGGDGGGGKGRERNAGVGGLCPAHTGERAHTSPRTQSYVGPYVFWCLPCVVRADRRPRPAHCYALLSSGLGMGVM